MRIPLAAYGRAEIAKSVVATAVGIGVSCWFATIIGWGWGAGFIAVWVLLFAYVLVFFRDFERTVPAGDGLLAPADGTVTDVGTVTEDQFIGGPALKIGIFMSLVSCHVNRWPVDGTVAWAEHRPGKCLNAMDPRSAIDNESWWIGLETAFGRVLVRQITGVVARRIVCGAAVGDPAVRGERFGMIKFGSRSELYVPAESGLAAAVQPGDAVFAGLTVLMRPGAAAPQPVAAAQEAGA